MSTVTEGYAKLFSSILLSSVWQEDDATRIVWIAMLALANKLGEVTSSLPGLAHISRVPNEACEHAIQVLSSPDPTSQNPANEGRRIEKIERGWRILNYQDFRRRLSIEERREYKAMKQREYRRVDNSGQCGNTVDNPPDNADADSKAEADAKAMGLPNNLNTKEFRSTWNEWVDHRKHKRQSLTAEAIKRQWKKLSAMGLDRAIAAINHSIEMGWTGIFEEKSQTTAAQRKAERSKGEYPSNVNIEKLIK